ncbi:CD44 antigen isoform X4 [Alligator mississippiensis]|uniref:CD44 antigen isoform X4 n=1 Tax=Alligator mississippiensis TaxID=8496 RepID=UPI000907009C|nr:CD44 antigen isoform X4 [Alligator mississippiensis]
MVKFLLWATFGLCFLKLCEAQTQFNISCRYAGVFHVEKNRRYSLMREDAVVLCRALNSTLPTMEQMEKAYKLGFETCRYGFIEDKIVLPRINPYHLCAANYTGIYVLSSNTTQPYDTYCYNASETRDKACEPIQKLDLSFDNSSLADQNQIVIDNADGSRYTDGVKNPDPTPPVYDNTVGSGSSQDTTTHDDPSLDFSGAGKKEYTSTGPGDENTSMGTTASSIPMGPKDFPGKDSSDPYKQHPTSSTVDLYRLAPQEASVPSQWSPIHWSWSHQHPREQEPTQASGADKDLDDSYPEEETEDPFSSDYVSGWDDEYKEKSPSITTMDSQNAIFLKNTTQSHWRPVYIEDKENKPTFSSNDVDSHGDAKQIDSTQDPLLHNVHLGWDKQESNTRNSTVDTVKPTLFHEVESGHSSSAAEDSSEEKPTQDPLSLGLHPGRNVVDHSLNSTNDTVLPGITPPTKSEHSSTVIASKEKEPEDSTEDPLFHGIHPGRNVVDHSLSNVTKDNVLSRISPPSESEHSSTEDSSEGDKLEGSTPSSLSPFESGWDSKDTYPANTTGDSMLHGLIPPNMSKHEENETSHSAAVTSIDGSLHEHSTQVPPSVVDHLGGSTEEKYPTKTIEKNVLFDLTPPSESKREDQTTHRDVTSKPEASTQGSLWHGIPPERGTENEYSTTTPKDGVLPGIIPPRERDHKNDTSHTVNSTIIITDVVSTDESSTQDSLTPAHKPGRGPEAKHPISTSRKNVSHETTPANGKKEGAVTSKPEASTQDPLWHAIPPEWGNGNEYSTTTPKDVALPQVTPPRERDHNNDTSHTAVFFTDAKPEDTTQDSLTPAHKPGWGPEAKPPTSTSREHVSHETAPSNGNEEGIESSDMGTTVTSRPEASTQESVWHNIPPEWGNGNEYSTATSKDVALRGVTPPKDRDHKNDTSHTVVDSTDGSKYEASTQEPLTPGRDKEDTYPTKNIRPTVIPNLFPEIERDPGRKPTPPATSSTSNRFGRRGSHIGDTDTTSFPRQTTTTVIISQPRSAKIPEWLIIVAALVALILILAVCIAVNSRRRCGQKKKLVINNGKGAVEDKKIGGLNGEASKSQEMVHLVHKEQSNDRTGQYDEFLTTDETQNQEADMKTGV